MGIKLAAHTSVRAHIYYNLMEESSHANRSHICAYTRAHAAKFYLRACRSSVANGRSMYNSFSIAAGITPHCGELEIGTVH